MKLVIQRVSEAAVEAEGHRARIGRGLTILVGVEKGDTSVEADWLAEKVAVLRIFEDESEKMNRSLRFVASRNRKGSSRFCWTRRFN